ncbi:hypothetical protein A3203_32690 [Burkholderia cenocepacia]|nr:hypothetical protein A3203_32690 [Burkholderia cenocepacia]
MRLLRLAGDSIDLAGNRAFQLNQLRQFRVAGSWMVSPRKLGAAYKLECIERDLFEFGATASGEEAHDMAVRHRSVCRFPYETMNADPPPGWHWVIVGYLLLEITVLAQAQ